MRSVPNSVHRVYRVRQRSRYKIWRVVVLVIALGLSLALFHRANTATTQLPFPETQFSLDRVETMK